MGNISVSAFRELLSEERDQLREGFSPWVSVTNGNTLVVACFEVPSGWACQHWVGQSSEKVAGGNDCSGQS